MRLRIRRMADLKSPQRKWVGTLIIGGRGDGDVEEGKDKDKEVADDTEDKPPGEMGKVIANKFWECMSFRQECVAGP